ncbi:uncharacterized protein LOC119552828 [Drosophila subpulchrella]|uniref:uncharacterized protein LOC119552828 n=1 Tax=Drosophila subpulchrella TaxID=1486046 RepID=UPI0018A1B3B9|nr:uncharacterized protein LOC119552828 [Drosophila subpulchrella]
MKIIAYLVLLALAIAQSDASRSATSDQVTISECPARSVPQIRAEASEFEISLLFYYVSWASEARQARLVYNGLAHYYQEYAYFGAIDCWHLQCNCSRTLMPAPGVVGAGGYPDKWPTLVVRYGQRQMLQYQGAWSFEELARFMNHLLQPLDRAHSSQELAAIRKHSDAVVLGLLDSPDDRAYKMYLGAGLRWLELDPERNIRFTVNFGSSAKKMLKSPGAKLPQFVVIDSRNGVHTFNSTSVDWKAMDILRWVRNTLKNTSLFSNGYGTPMTIAMKARHVPVLAMGVRMNQYHHASVMGEEMASAQKKQSEGCEDYWNTVREQPEESFSHLLVPKELFRESVQPHTCYPAWKINRVTLKNYYRINRYLDHLWRQYSHQNDRRKRKVPHLLRLHSRNLCLAHSQHGTPAMKIGIAKMVTKYGQLIWQHSAENAAHNRSLGVVIFDSVKYRDYLHQLGIQQHHQQVQVFILDAAEESLYVMPQQNTFSYVALKDFIRRFYARTLPRIHKNAPATRDSAFSRQYNRQMLLQALLRQNATNVVFMHRPDCALSGVLSQAFLQVSALLSSSEVHFVRFDSQANDLPWELAMPISPSLVVFPRAKPTESMVFPTDVRIDVQSVFAFVIAQLEPEQQVRSVLTSCRRRMRNVRSCLDFARNLVLQHVSQYLKFWEIYERERDVILSHLKEFNDLHMSIESSIRL